MKTPVTVATAKSWVAEAERIVDEAEMLVIVEGASRASMAALGLAQFLRANARARLEEARGVS